MPPTVIIIRHAQALHNATKDWTIRDAPLSDLGHEQCLELAEKLKQDDLAQKIDLIITSPMRRTCETTMEALGWLIDERKQQGNPIPVLANASWQGTFF